MASAILDSNILIYYVAGFQLIPDLEMNVYAISAVTVFELLRYPGLPEKEERALLQAVGFCEVIPVSDTVAFRAALLNRIRDRDKKMDLLIASTALELGIPLVTKNIKDFKNIPGLVVRSTL